MSTYYLLRKANGDILTVEIKGKEYIAVWDSDTAVRRSKRANPELMVYVPAVVDRRLIERKFPNPSVSFFLVDSRDPDLRTGHEISADELLAEPELAQAA